MKAEQEAMQRALMRMMSARLAASFGTWRATAAEGNRAATTNGWRDPEDADTGEAVDRIRGMASDCCSGEHYGDGDSACTVADGVGEAGSII